MAISDAISRLQSAKSALKTSIEGKGVTVSSSAKLEDYPALVDSIQAGGGSSDDYELMSFQNGTEFEAPLGEKNLLISIFNGSFATANVTVTNSSTSKYFTYSIPALKTYRFICNKNLNIVYVSTGTSTTIK